jgi:D-sedoheptulose 7-phosphate isomerase
MKIIESILEHKNIIDQLLNQEITLEVERIIDCVTNSLANGNKVYLCGNGGSAADAQHLAAEFTGRFFLERKALPAEALHCNSSYVTAVGNDYGYEYVYSRILDGIGKSGDILIGLSTSGNSINILKAFEVARKNGIKTILFSGETGGILKEISDFSILVPSKSTPRIQECHILIGHIICEIVEKNIFYEKI